VRTKTLHGNSFAVRTDLLEPWRARSREGGAMLKVVPRGKLEELRELSAHEDRAVREAFGRWPEEGARSAGAAVVRTWQSTGAGNLFLCDCLASWPSPVLVLVSESHIRRHYGAPWPDHHPDCDFFRDYVEQRVIARSFARKRDGRPVSLIGRLAETGAETVPRVTGCSYGQCRGTLATTLMQLIDTAGLNVISEAGGFPSISEQFRIGCGSERDLASPSANRSSMSARRAGARRTGLTLT
jgi:hypothetical protein